MPSNTGSMRINKLFFYSLCLVPPIFILYFIHSYGFITPMADQWDLVPYLEKMESGTLRFPELWAQHNEHRIFFPRLVMLGLARLTDWDIRWELYTSFIIVLMTLFLFYKLLKLTVNEELVPVLTAVLAISIFSASQFGNWIWGWQMQIFMGNLGFAAALFSVVRWPGEWKGIVLAFCAALLAGFSFSNGLLVFPIILALLIIDKREKSQIYMWSAAMVLVFLFYFWDFHKPPQNTQLAYLFKFPLDFLRFVLIELGTPLAGYSEDGDIRCSLYLGLIFFILLIGALILIRLREGKFPSKKLPWLAIIFYSLLSACITGVGRLDLGPQQANLSKYTTFSLFFAAGVLVILFEVLHSFRKNIFRFAGWSLLIIFVFFSVREAKETIEMRDWRKQAMREFIPCLYYEDFAPDECIQAFHPVPEIIRERIKILRRIGIWEKILKRVPIPEFYPVRPPVQAPPLKGADE